MAEHTTVTPRSPRLPGLDAEATPLIGVGLGLTGLAIGLRPRLVPWTLALTAMTALLYRDPDRVTPDDSSTLFAPADGIVIGIDELYEHRFLHTDAVRLAIAVAPLDVPVQRAPTSGVVAYLEHVSGQYRPVWDLRSGEQNERQHIGLHTDWGPVLITLVAGWLARRIVCRVGLGDRVETGARLSTVRLGARVDLLLPADVVRGLPEVGDRVEGGLTAIGRLPL
jgi:phosphatidylserine decarboxylase